MKAVMVVEDMRKAGDTTGVASTMNNARNQEKQGK
jgi:hypothetical protein